MKKFLAVVLEMTMNPLAKITFSCKRMARHGIAFPFRAVIGLAALSLLNCVAFGQPFSGPGVFSGNAQFGAPGGGGAPLTYSARTDGCVNPTATPSSCVGGTTTGQAGATLLFQEGVSDPIPTGFAATTISSGSCPSGLTPSTYPAYCVAPINATATDPDFNSYLVMASDDTLQNNGDSWVVSWNGGDTSFSQDESLMTMGASNGAATILNLSPTSIHAKTCATSPCVNKTGIFYANSGGGDSTHLARGSNIYFSRNPAEPTTLYEQLGTLVSKLVITSSIASPGTGTLSRTTYADFANGSGGYGGVLPDITVGACTSTYANSWTGNFAVSSDGSVGYGMTGGYDWCAAWTPADVIGNAIFIHPTVGNAANHGFQATTISGATGATEPNWDSVCATTCTDGGVTWTNIGSLQGQGPGFDIVFFGPAGSAAPGYSRVNTRLAKIYRGTGNSAPAGAITTNDPVACTRTLEAPCGTGVTVNLPDEFTLHGAPNLMRGGWMRFGPTGAGAVNAPGNWNSGTLTCQPNGASDVWAGAWNSGTTYTSKKTVSYTDGTSAYYVATTHASNLNQAPRTGGVVNTTYWTQQEAYCGHYYWNVVTTLVSPTTAWSAVGGHSAIRYLYDYYGGKYTKGLISQPSAQLSPPNGPITVNPGTNLIATSFPADDHSTSANSGALDLQPVFAVSGDVPSWLTSYTAACYDEVCAVDASGSGPMYRFAHTYNQGVNQNFPVQDAEGNISPLGDLLLVSTDMMGTRGDLVTETKACTNVRAMLKATTGMTLALNDTVFPIAANAGYYIFQATVGGLTSGAAPTGGWCQTLNCTATWGAATVKNIGANTCRGDAVIVDLLSAHPAPASGPAWTGILAPARATDWTQAGIPGGIPSATWANCVTTQCNTVNGGTVTAASVNAALASAPNNTVVRIPAGSFTLTSTSIFTNRGTVVLRGAGPQSTTINLGSANILMGTNGSGGEGSYPGNLVQTNWTGGLTTGSTVLTLASTTGIVAGQNVILDQLNAAWVYTTGVEGPCTSGNSCGRSSSPLQFNGSSARAQPEMVHVVSVNSGTQITISAPGIAFDHSSGLTPMAFFWNSGVGNIQYDGVENMHINANGNDFAVNLAFCDYCWAKNVWIENIARSGVYFWWSTHDVFRDSYMSASNTSGAPTEYGVEVLASSYALVENNIFFGVTANILPETSYGLVVGYNYILNTATGAQFGSMESHLAHDYMNLFEGNVAAEIMYDNSWGSASQNTSFRNYMSGHSPNKSNYRAALKINSHNHYMNIVANVLGDLTYHTQYACDNNNLQATDNYEYDLGFWNSCVNGIDGSNPYDTVTQSSLMRWGNWDAVTWKANGNTNGVRWCTGSGAGNPACTASETASTDPTVPGLASPATSFPASFYNGSTSAHPSCGTGLSFWKNPGSGTCPIYPPIGPDVTCSTNCISNTASHVAEIPAQLCYINTAKDANGFLTAFDAAVCYTTDP